MDVALFTRFDCSHKVKNEKSKQNATYHTVLAGLPMQGLRKLTHISFEIFSMPGLYTDPALFLLAGIVHFQ